MKISDLYDGVLVKSGYLRALEEQSAAGQAMLELRAAWKPDGVQIGHIRL